jgi:hypothetical protein
MASSFQSVTAPAIWVINASDCSKKVFPLALIDGPLQVVPQIIDFTVSP